MDPCKFIRIVISNLAIRYPSKTPHHSDLPTSYFCKLKLTHFPTQSAPIPILPSDAAYPDPRTFSGSGSVCFTLTRPDVDKLVFSKKLSKRPELKIDVCSSRNGTGCGFGSAGKLVGRVTVPLEITQQTAEGKGSTVVRNGWVELGERKKKGEGKNPEVYLSVVANPDPRFVFEFDSEPECSPQVLQVQGTIKQPVFSCKFGFKNATCYSGSGDCSFKSEKREHNHHRNQSKRERKGWSITIHDLSGSPVAAASMVTPFVTSNGSDRVGRANPGAWLILRPGGATWVPWGRLEAWSDGPNRVGHRFELFHESGPATIMGPDGITLAQSSVPARPGGKFSIDVTSCTSPAVSPSSSMDLGSGSSSGSESGFGLGWWPGLMYKGFVMSSRVGGGKAPLVEVGSQHVTCTEDAAVFVALAAAVDLSMDACRPFSEKLRKELRQPSGEFVV